MFSLVVPYERSGREHRAAPGPVPAGRTRPGTTAKVFDCHRQWIGMAMSCT